MSALFLLIVVSLFVALGFLGLFFWSVGSGQYEDDFTPAVRILFEDKPLNASVPTESEETPPSP